MNLKQSFTRNFYWPLAQKIKGEHSLRALSELIDSQWWSQDELSAMQWQMVRNTVHKASQKVPYYQKALTQIGWDFRNVNFSYEDFLNIPIVEKDVLRDRISEFLNPCYKGRITCGRTSGSSGQSLRLFYDSEHESYSDAARWRAKNWWGVELGSPQVAIWGRSFASYKDRWSQKAKSYMMNTQLFSAFDINEETLEIIWHKIQRFRPKIIYGYPSAIYPLSVYLKETKKNARRLGVKVIMTTAESITSQQRAHVEDTFGCKTANEYGCSETGGFVYECPHGRWHISCELTYIEFLDPKGNHVTPGQSGEIIITHLRNEYMPLIRYRVGDIGTFLDSECSCKRGLPLMEVVVSKEIDKVKLANGKCFSSEIFDYINLAVMKRFPGSIDQFRVIQKAFDFFDIEFVAGKGSVDEAEFFFKYLIEKQIGQSLHFNIKRVSQIRREPSGKLRYFISEVNTSHGQ
jgi:phenylacetate-CoA ligase